MRVVAKAQAGAGGASIMGENRPDRAALKADSGLRALRRTAGGIGGSTIQGYCPSCRANRNSDISERSKP